MRRLASISDKHPRRSGICLYGRLAVDEASYFRNKGNDLAVKACRKSGGLGLKTVEIRLKAVSRSIPLNCKCNY